MTIYFTGSEMGAFVPSDSSAVENTNVNEFGRDNAFSRAAIGCTTSAVYAEGDPGASLTTAWAHFRMYISGSGGGSSKPATRYMWLDASGVERVRVRSDTGLGTIALEYNVGSGWVSAGSAAVTLLETNQDIDLGVVCNSASGSLALYIAGTKRIEATGVDLSAITALRKFRFYGFDIIFVDTWATYFSQVIVANEPTIGMRLLTVPATGTGATSEFTGTFAEIDEAIYNDGDFVNSSTANHVELFTHSTALPSGYSVRAVGVTARAKKGGSGPTNLQLAVRSGGTTYFSASKALDAGYGAFVEVWETDPATSAAFTSAAFTSLQFGVKAIA